MHTVYSWIKCRIYVDIISYIMGYKQTAYTEICRRTCAVIPWPVKFVRLIIRTYSIDSDRLCDDSPCRLLLDTTFMRVYTAYNNSKFGRI